MTVKRLAAARALPVLAQRPPARGRPSEEPRKSHHQPLASDPALPDHERPVSRASDLAQSFAVALLVGIELVDPERPVSFRHRGPHAASVPVPETSVDEDGPSASPVGEIGRSWKAPVPGAEAMAQCVDTAPDGELRGSTMLPDATQPLRCRVVRREAHTSIA